MRKTFLSAFYLRHRQLTAAFILLAVLLIVTITTGFGLGNVITRTVPTADRATTESVKEAEKMLMETGDTDSSTALLIQDVDITNPETAHAMGELYKPYRAELTKKYGLEERRELLDPFLFKQNKIALTSNPLIGNNKTSFIILVTPARERTDSEKYNIAQGAKAKLLSFGSKLEQTLPAAKVTLNSRVYSNELARWNTLKGILVILVFAGLVSAAGFYLTTRRPAAALAGSMATLFSATVGLFISWIGTFLVDYPTHLLPVIVLTSSLLGIIITAVIQTIDAHRIERGGRVSSSSTSAKSLLGRLDRRRIIQFAQRIWAARLVLLVSFLVPFTVFLLNALIPLSHVDIFALTMLGATALIWISSILFTPILQLVMEKRLPSRADIDRPTGKLSKLDIANYPDRLSWLDRVERYLTLTYQQTAFAKNLGAPAFAIILFLLTCLPWTVISPKAATAAELSNAKDIVQFQRVAEENFPALAPKDFSVIAKSSPSELTHWAEETVAKSALLVISSTAETIGEGKFSTITFSYRIAEPNFIQQENALHTLTAAKSDFPHAVYSESTRNIQVITATKDALSWILPVLFVFALLALYLVFANLLLAVIHVLAGAIMVASSIGLTSLVAASGILRYLPGIGLDKQLDVTGLVIGSFLSIIIISVILLEPQVMDRPATSRTVWLVIGIGGGLSALSGQLASATIGIILINTVLITIVASLLIIPQITYFSSAPNSRLFSRNHKILKLHNLVREYLHHLFAPRDEDVAPAQPQEATASASVSTTTTPNLSPTQRSRRMLSRMHRRKVVEAEDDLQTEDKQD